MHRLIVLLSACLLWHNPVLAAAGGHHDHQAVPAPAACSDPAAAPSLPCALAPSARFDGNGRLWLAWAYGGHVYVNHSDDRGQAFSPPVAVNRIPEVIAAHGENRPKIVVDNAGRVFVSWTTPLLKRYTGNIRFSRSLDGGAHFAEPLTVNDNLDITSHRFEALGVNERGDVYLAWLDKRDQVAARQAGGEYRGAALYYTVSEDGGEHFLANAKITDHTCECCRVSLAIDRDQLPVVMWRNIYGDNERDHGLVKFAGREKPGSPRRVSHDQWRVDACPHHGPALSIAGDGVYHSVWFNNAPERHGLFYAQSSDQGQSFSTPLHFGDYQAGAAHPDVLSLGRRVVLAWREFDGRQSHVLVMQSSDGGRQWSTPQRVASSEAEADYPFLLADGRQVYLAWHRRGEGFGLFPITERMAEFNADTRH